MVCILLSCTIYLQNWTVAQKMLTAFRVTFEFYIKSFPSLLKDVLAVLLPRIFYFSSLFEVKKYGLIRGQQLCTRDCSMQNYTVFHAWHSCLLIGRMSVLIYYLESCSCHLRNLKFSKIKIQFKVISVIKILHV